MILLSEVSMLVCFSHLLYFFRLIHLKYTKCEYTVMINTIRSACYVPDMTDHFIWYTSYTHNSVKQAVSSPSQTGFTTQRSHLCKDTKLKRCGAGIQTQLWFPLKVMHCIGKFSFHYQGRQTWCLGLLSASYLPLCHLGFLVLKNKY